MKHNTPIENFKDNPPQYTFKIDYYYKNRDLHIK